MIREKEGMVEVLWGNKEREKREVREREQREDRKEKKQMGVEKEEHHYLPRLVVQLPQALRYSSENTSSRLDSAVKCCSSEILVSKVRLGKGSGPRD